MSEFTDRLDARRKELGLSLRDLTSLLQLRGVDVSYETVAFWFRGKRGDRWRPDELVPLLALLQADLKTMVTGADTTPPDLSGPIYNPVAREVALLPEEQQTALLAFIKSFRR